MVFTARTDSELVDVMNEAVTDGSSHEFVITNLMNSELFLSEVTSDIQFLYGNEDVFAVHTENHQHSSIAIIRLGYNFDVPHGHGYNVVWMSEMLEVSEADISRARGLLDEVSIADIYHWRSILEFLQRIYSSAAYWVATRIPEASDTAERFMEIALHRNGFDFEEEIHIDDDIVVSRYGEVFTLSDGVVYRGHRFPYTGDSDDCAR